MTSSEIYAVIWRELQRLIRTGAVTRRGRPRNDGENELYYLQTRAYKQALKNLPSDLRSDWEKRPMLLAHLPKMQELFNAQKRANTRAIKRVESGLSPLEPALSSQAKLRAEATAVRLQATAMAIALIEASNGKVTSKTVALKMKTMYVDICVVAIETTRKDIAKIRHGRPK
jgi:hypothetical protein